MNAPSKQCRNCGGGEFYSQTVDARGDRGLNLLPIGLWINGQFRIRVCGNCGIVDWFVPQELLPKVKEFFSPE
jgi:hypothetical protein